MKNPAVRERQKTLLPFPLSATLFSRVLVAVPVPAGPGGGLGDGAAALGAEGGGPRRSPFESAEAAERRRVGIGLVEDRTAGDHLDALGRRLAPRARRPDEIGRLRFGALLEEVADQAAAADGELDGPGRCPSCLSAQEHRYTRAPRSPARRYRRAGPTVPVTHPGSPGAGDSINVSAQALMLERSRTAGRRL